MRGATCILVRVKLRLYLGCSRHRQEPPIAVWKLADASKTAFGGVELDDARRDGRWFGPQLGLVWSV